MNTAAFTPESATATPPVTIGETEKAIVVEAEMPGLDKASISLELTGDELIIKGDRKTETAPEGYTLIHRERHPARYERTFILGAEVEKQGIAAAYENGVLSITIPKVREKQPQRIEIRS
jgi:HSP20 family protein